MIEGEEICAELSITTERLEIWVRQGWLLPAREGDRPSFGPADLARARLIASLSRDFGANEEGIDLILHLLDQVHDLRRALQATRIAADRMDAKAREELLRYLSEES